MKMKSHFILCLILFSGGLYADSERVENLENGYIRYCENGNKLLYENGQYRFFIKRNNNKFYEFEGSINLKPCTIADGKGKLKLHNSVVIGEWKNGVRNGSIVENFNNGDKQESYFVNGHLEGKVVYTYADGKQNIKYYKNDKLIDTSDQTAQKPAQPQEENKPELKSGTYETSCKNGNKFTAKYENDELKELVKVTLKAGGSFVGSFDYVNCIPSNGKGKIQFTDGYMEGYFIDGVLDGEAIAHYSDGHQETLNYLLGEIKEAPPQVAKADPLKNLPANKQYINDPNFADNLLKGLDRLAAEDARKKAEQESQKAIAKGVYEDCEHYPHDPLNIKGCIKQQSQPLSIAGSDRKEQAPPQSATQNGEEEEEADLTGFVSQKAIQKHLNALGAFVIDVDMLVLDTVTIHDSKIIIENGKAGFIAKATAIKDVGFFDKWEGLADVKGDVVFYLNSEGSKLHGEVRNIEIFNFDKREFEFAYNHAKNLILDLAYKNTVYDFPIPPLGFSNEVGGKKLSSRFYNPKITLLNHKVKISFDVEASG